jgi:chromosome segregation ATPase
LLSAKSDLHEVIKKLIGPLMRIFEKTFNFVNENFKKLYVKLFWWRRSGYST